MVTGLAKLTTDIDKILEAAKRFRRQAENTTLKGNVSKYFTPDPFTGKLPDTPYSVSGTQAKNLGIDLPNDWTLQANLEDTEKGQVIRFKQITPSGWQILSEDKFLNPQGVEYTKAQLESMGAEAKLETGLYTPVEQAPLSEVPLAPAAETVDFSSIEPFKTGQNEAGEDLYDIRAASRAGVPKELLIKAFGEETYAKAIAPPVPPAGYYWDEANDAFLPDASTIMESFTIQVFEDVFPDIFSDLPEDTHLDVTTELLNQLLGNNEQVQDWFVAELGKKGRTVDTEFLLKRVFPNIREDEVAILFGETPAQAEITITEKDMSQLRGLLHSQTGMPLQDFQSKFGMTEEQFNQGSDYWTPEQQKAIRAAYQQGERLVSSRDANGNRFVKVEGKPTGAYEKFNEMVVYAASEYTLFHVAGYGVTATDLVGLATIIYGGVVGVKFATQLVASGWGRFLELRLRNNLRTMAKANGLEIPKETEDTFVNTAMNSPTMRQWMNKNALKSWFKPDAKGKINPEIAKNVYNEADQTALALAKDYVTQVPKGTQTGAMAFGGLPKPIPPKEPWQMTNVEYAKSKLPASQAGQVTSFQKSFAPQHLVEIKAALEAGKPIPPEVLKDYPDLAKGVAPATPAPTPAVTAGEVPKPITPTPEVELYQKQAELTGLQEYVSSEPATALVNLIKKTGWYKGEVKNLTLKQYRDLTGKQDIPQNILTPDNKHVRWEYALDQLASERGYESGDALKEAIEDAGTNLARINELKTEIAKVEAGLEPSLPPIPPELPPQQTLVEPEPAPPPPENAARLVYDRIQFEPEQTGFTDKVRQGWHKFNVKMVDDLFAIKKVVDQSTKGGVKLSIEENPYLSARLLRGVTGKANVFLEQGTFGKKFWKTQKGKAIPNFTGESLENILKEVREPKVWRDFSTYLVAKRSFDLSLRNIETGISEAESAAAIGELEKAYPQFAGLAERVYKYQDNLLVYAKEMGLVSEDLLAKLHKFGNYVPFYRVFNELQAKGLMGKKMANIAQPIKKIKGSEREIINPLESIVKNTYVIINSAERNQVGIMLANLVDKNPELVDVFERVKTPIARVAGITAKELGVEIEGMTSEDAEAVVDIFRPSFFTRGDEVTVLIDGTKRYYRVDQDLRDALLNLDRESLGMLGKIFGAPARWLRAGATLSPDFMVRNPARDQMTAFVYSNYGFLPGVDFLSGLASIIAKDADYQLFRASGAEHSMLVSMDREYLSKTFNEIVEGRKFTFYVKHPMELLRIVSELGEKATRLGEFKGGLRRGVSPLEAGYSARSVTLDFSQSGTTAHAVNNLIAFFNANIRGWGKMASSFKEHPLRTSLKVFLGITVPSILLYLANRDDERWKEIPQWQKDLFWIVMTEDNIYRIPKPFELGIIFGSMPERFMEWLDNKDPELFKKAFANLVEAGSPGFIPTAGLPILEWMTNYSFFKGTAIVPASREKMPPELQYTAWTSEVSKQIGELLKLPPAKIDNTIYAYTAGLGRYAVDVLDEILKRTGISPDIPEPSPTLADTPVIKAFVVRSPYGSSGATVEKFYDTLEKYEQGEKYLKEMLELDEQSKFETFKAAHPELLFFYEFSADPEKEGIFYSATARYLRRVARDMTELRNKQDEIYKAKDISPEEKRQLVDEIDVLKTEVAQKALNLIGEGKPQVLQDSINTSISKLGNVRDDSPVLSLEEPDIYTTRTLHTDFGNILEAVKQEELSKLEGIDPLAFAYLEVRRIENEVDSIPNKKIYKIKPKMFEGLTFDVYYQAWQTGIIKNKELEKLSRRDLELLREYNALEKPGQKQFLIDHPELSVNPHTEWLKSHPNENAQLAIWGQAKIVTKKAYTEFNRLVKELDIPDNGLPSLILPPESSIDTHFTYLDMVSENQGNSWEAQLLLKEDDEKAKKAGVPSYVDWRTKGGEPLELSDTPMASLELKTDPKFRGIYDKLKNFSDKDSPDYKDNEIKDENGLTARDRAVAELKTTEIDGDFTYQDVERKVKILELGTDEKPIDDKLVNDYIEYMRIGDQPERGSSSAESMLYRVDNPDFDSFITDENIWGGNALKPLNQNVIPVWRIDAKYREQDTEYDAIKDPDAREQTRLRNEYLENNPEYRQDRRRREAYLMTNSKTGERFPEAQIENYVAYSELSTKGKRRDRFLAENPEFAQAMHTIAGIDLPDPKKVPAVQYDDIYDQYREQFDELDGYGNHESEFYIEDPEARAEARDAIRFTNGKLNDFGIAEVRRGGYGLFVQQEYIDRFVDWRRIDLEGIPASWPKDDKGNRLTWYEDDWYLIEHPAFYENIYLKHLGLEKRDLTKVPTREVFSLYAQYVLLIPGKRREDFRFDNRDLENWLLLTKKVSEPIWDKRRRESQTPSERAREELEKIEKLLE